MTDALRRSTSGSGTSCVAMVMGSDGICSATSLPPEENSNSLARFRQFLVSIPWNKTLVTTRVWV